MTRFGWVMTTYVSTLGIGLSALFHPMPSVETYVAMTQPKRVMGRSSVV